MTNQHPPPEPMIVQLNATAIAAALQDVARKRILAGKKRTNDLNLNDDDVEVVINSHIASVIQGVLADPEIARQLASSITQAFHAAIVDVVRSEAERIARAAVRKGMKAGVESVVAAALAGVGIAPKAAP